MSDERQSVWELMTYYRQFHHALVTWYVTIVGFVFAGVLAADPSTIGHHKVAVGLCLAVVWVFTIWFVVIAADYSGRIEWLRLQWNNAVPEENWRTKHYDAASKYTGHGAIFFLVVFLFFGIATSLLIVAQLWR